MLSKGKLALVNLIVAFLGAISTSLAGLLLRTYLNSPLKNDIAMSAEILLGSITVLAMLVANGVLLALERWQKKGFAAIRDSVDEQVRSIAASLHEFKNSIEFRLDEIGLTRLPADLPPGLFLALARPLLHQCRNGIEHIVRGAKSYSAREYYAEACRVISEMICGDTINAVCADTRWGLPNAIRYFFENISAATRGASVTRIFVVPTRDIPERLRKCMDSHYEAGATVLLLTKDSDLYRNLPDLFIPDGVGFVILKRNGELEARIHYSSSGPQNFGKVYRDPEVVNVLQAWFDELKRVADVYEPARLAKVTTSPVAASRSPLPAPRAGAAAQDAVLFVAEEVPGALRNNGVASDFGDESSQASFLASLVVSHDAVVYKPDRQTGA